MTTLQSKITLRQFELFSEWVIVGKGRRVESDPFLWFLPFFFFAFTSATVIARIVSSITMPDVTNDAVVGSP